VTEPKKSTTITFRIDHGLKQRVEIAIGVMPYHPSLTAVIERGLELAIEEMQRLSEVAGVIATAPVAAPVNRNDMVALRAMNEHHVISLSAMEARQSEAAE
jgi:hypothetical protein